MVEMLFRENPYLTELKVKVNSISENVITLDKTIFFSFSGGQQSDNGTMNGIEVIGSRKEENEIYYMLIKKPNFKVGDEIEVKIDGEVRDKLRRLHSAAHIVGDFFEKKFNISITEIIGSNVEVNKARLDYVFSENLSSFLHELENSINIYFENGHAVKHYKKYEDRWEWKCGDFICYCGGTHVKNTKEIGKIKLKRKNIGFKKERIEIYLN